MPVFEWNVPFVFLIFLKRSLVFRILLFSSISLWWSLRKALLSLLAIFWNSTFRWIYLSFSPLPFTAPLFSAICKASSNNHFAFLDFFFLGMVLITAFYTVLQTSSISLQALCLSDLMGSKLGKEYVKAIYYYPIYLTYVQSTSCEMLGWKKNKLESRLSGEIATTSDMQMTPPLWQKMKRNYRASWWKWKMRVKKLT